MPTVLVVDDEADIRALVRLVLERSDRGIEVVTEASDGVDALAAFAALDPPGVPAVVILDNRMPGPSGLDVAKEMLRRAAGQHIVLYSAHLTHEIVEQANLIGIDQCVSKEAVFELPAIVCRLVDPRSGDDC